MGELVAETPELRSGIRGLSPPLLHEVPVLTALAREFRNVDPHSLKPRNAEGVSGASGRIELDFRVLLASNFQREAQLDRAWVYILTNKPHGVLYTGMCNADLVRRIWEHREGDVRGFTRKYNLKTLVFFEPHQDVTYAAERERRIKRWRREWKIALIERFNPDWRDLYPDLLG